jgi:hypothetical protein
MKSHAHEKYSAATALAAVAIAASTFAGCSDQPLSCVETATCPPEGRDAGADAPSDGNWVGDVASSDGARSDAGVDATMDRAGDRSATPSDAPPDGARGNEAGRGNDAAFDAAGQDSSVADARVVDSRIGDGPTNDQNDQVDVTVIDAGTNVDVRADNSDTGTDTGAHVDARADNGDTGVDIGTNVPDASSDACSGTGCGGCGSGQTQCNGICCAAGQGCCSNQCAPLDTPEHCGSCTNVCDNGQTCNASKMCETPTWCKTQTIPSGVAATDYQCLDFDTGNFPPVGWTQNVMAPGMLSKTGTRFFSSPSALHTTFPLEPGVQGTSRLEWTTTASGSPVASIAVSSMVNPTLPEFELGWTRSVEILCVAFGTDFSQACLLYTYENPLMPWQANPYTGLYIHLQYRITDYAVVNDCPVAGSFATNVWSNIELRVPTSTGHVEAVVNGILSTCNNTAPNSAGIPATTVPLVFVGSHLDSRGAPMAPPSAWATAFDNVTVVVRR